MKTVDQVVKQDFKEKHPTRGYGGKYGTEQVMDKVISKLYYQTKKIEKLIFF
jgi:ribosomal protein L34E